MPFQMLFSVSSQREARPATYSLLILKRTSLKKKKIPFLLRKHRGRKQALAGSLAKCETMRSSNNSSGGTCKWDNSFVMKVHTIRFRTPPQLWLSQQSQIYWKSGYNSKLFFFFLIISCPFYTIYSLGKVYTMSN